MRQRILDLRGYNYNQVHDMYLDGSIGQSLWEAWARVWEWSSPRFGGIPGFRHDVFWNKYGKARYYAKINKVRSAFGMPVLNLT